MDRRALQGKIVKLESVVSHIRPMQRTLDRESRIFDAGIEMQSDGHLAVRWNAGHRSHSRP